MVELLDIKSNRSARKYSLKTQALRVAWAFFHVFFYCSPRPAYIVRAWMLKLFGAKIGRAVQVSNTCKIFAPWNLEIGDFSAVGNQTNLYNLGPLRIGQNVTVSQGTHVCGGTHDYNDSKMKLIKSPIVIKENAWVCADAFVGPGVTVGEYAIVAARGVCVKDVDDYCIVGGNPAKTIGKRVPPS